MDARALSSLCVKRAPGNVKNLYNIARYAALPRANHPELRGLS